MRVRALTALVLLCVPAAAAAETFEIGPSADGGTTHTSETVLQEGQTYKITVSGTLSVVFTTLQPPRNERYDAFYCVETDWPERESACTPDKPDPSIAADQGFGFSVHLNADENGGPVKYQGSHEYTKSVKAAKTGPVNFSTRPFSQTDVQAWSGAFTVTIVQPGAKLCSGETATIVGEEEAGVNRIVGTRGDDVIVGTNSEDLILGGGGQDTICALGGGDHVDGGGARDFLYGGAGRDRLIGGTGDGGDVLEGGAAADRLRGGGGGDSMKGGAGDDELDSGAGSDRDLDIFDGGTGDDELLSRHGGSTADYRTSPAPITLDLAAGTARGQGADTLRGVFRIVFGSRFGDTLRGSERPDNLLGEAGDDILDGRGDDDTLSGGEGNDSLTGGKGADSCDGETLVTCEVAAT